MQKGFATLEIILATLIIAVLVTCAVPNAVRIIDKASLDYETKRLYSELRFLQALDRSRSVDTTCMGNYFKWQPDSKESVLIIYKENQPNSWKVMSKMGHSGKSVRSEHILSNGEIISFTKENLTQITFDSTGHISSDGTINLTSRNEKNTSSIVINTVGRILVGAYK